MRRIEINLNHMSRRDELLISSSHYICFQNSDSYLALRRVQSRAYNNKKKTCNRWPETVGGLLTFVGDQDSVVELMLDHPASLNWMGQFPSQGSLSTRCGAPHPLDRDMRDEILWRVRGLFSIKSSIEASPILTKLLLLDVCFAFIAFLYRISIDSFE